MRDARRTIVAGRAVRSGLLVAVLATMPANVQACGVFVDPFKTRDFGTTGDQQYQLSVEIPDKWTAGVEVSVSLKPGATELVRCWNTWGGSASLAMEGCTIPAGMSPDACSLRAQKGTSADPTILRFKLDMAAAIGAPTEVGCVLRGVYNGYDATSYDGEACVANPPPPPVRYVPCVDTSFEMHVSHLWNAHNKKDVVNWQAQVRVRSWQEGREVQLRFPRGSRFAVADISGAHVVQAEEYEATVRLEQVGGVCGAKIGVHTAELPPPTSGRRLEPIARRGLYYEACFSITERPHDSETNVNETARNLQKTIKHT